MITSYTRFLETVDKAQSEERPEIAYLTPRLNGYVSTETGDYADQLDGIQARGLKFLHCSFEGLKLGHAEFRECSFYGCSFRNADLHSAAFLYCDLQGANFAGADVTNVNWSGSTGATFDHAEFLADFKADSEGLLVYKTFHSSYAANSNWVIEPGSVLTEMVNTNVHLDCACGINVASIGWVLDEVSQEGTGIWELRIAWRDLPGLVIPVDSHGKMRVQRATLLRELTRREAYEIAGNPYRYSYDDEPVDDEPVDDEPDDYQDDTDE